MKTEKMYIAKRIGLVTAIVIMVICSWFPSLDAAANQHVDDGLKRALVSFATARAANAVISAMEGTKIAVQPMGIGLTLAPGQLLDSVNDLVRQFSHLMLAASVAFAIEKVLISIGSNWAISALLTLIAAAWGYFYLREKSLPSWLTKTLVIFLMIRFAIPVAIIGSDMAFQEFMANDYKSSQQSMDVVAAQMDNLSASNTPMPDDQGVIDRMKGWTAHQAVDIKARVASWKQSAEQMTEHIVKLMAFFILQTLVIPIFLAWVLWSLARGTFEALPRTITGAAQKT